VTQEIHELQVIGGQEARLPSFSLPYVSALAAVAGRLPGQTGLWSELERLLLQFINVFL